jgi:hypothetical protein
VTFEIRNSSDQIALNLTSPYAERRLQNLTRELPLDRVLQVIVMTETVPVRMQ